MWIVIHPLHEEAGVVVELAVCFAVVKTAGVAAVNFAAFALHTVETAVFIRLALVVTEVAFGAARILQVVVVVARRIGVANRIVAGLF